MCIVCVVSSVCIVCWVIVCWVRVCWVCAVCWVYVGCMLGVCWVCVWCVVLDVSRKEEETKKEKHNENI